MNVFARTDNNGNNPYLSFASIKIPLNKDENINELTKSKAIPIVTSYMKEKGILKLARKI